ncbi:hypothetical protein CHS0354_018388 [Potamilus streckersoni]|uniref:DNA mismatch repair protein MutS n=1 Tax=Potamilus streckersoni TaxID=2493646 RepID=A0AAE0WA73_9BIVA|nr:hypothetical protein CHS0354_018388 [Potamilus streckersoni]
MKQYASFKQEHPDKMLLFRMGDFYEMFGEDAVRAADILKIQLTSREKNTENPLPMAGIPAHAAERYMFRLIGAGLKLAIEDSSLSKGIVKRGITRILTPGTVLEDNEANTGVNNYICAVDRDRQNHTALTFCDCSTGETETAVLPPDGDPEYLLSLLSLYRPSEVLMRPLPASKSEWQAPLKSHLEQIGTRGGYPVTVDFPDAYYFDEQACRKRLSEHFNVNTLSVFGIPDTPAAYTSAGALLYYLQETQREVPRHIIRLKPIAREGCMVLDDTTLKNLEIFYNISSASDEGTLFKVLNKTGTGMGRAG